MILVSGFGRFDDYERNRSGEIARSLDGQVLFGETIRGIELPVSWSGSFQLLAQVAEEVRPDALVSLGIAPTTALRVEMRAANSVAAKYDVDGALPPSSSIVPGAPRFLEATIPAVRIVSNLRAARDSFPQDLLPAVLSGDAGDYLCNWIYFRSLHQLSNLIPQQLFIHVPDDPSRAIDQAVMVSCLGVLAAVSGRREP